jgi:hypothetical protein
MQPQSETFAITPPRDDAMEDDNGGQEAQGMTLKQKLDAARQASAGRITPDQRLVMKRVIDELRAPAVMSRIAGVGQPMPPFALVGHDGSIHDSAKLLSQGPLAVSFFRGAW